MTVILNNRDDFNLKNIERAARNGEPVAFGPEAIARMSASRAAFLALVAAEPDRRIYGVTTTYGEGAKTLLSAEQRERFAKAPAPIEGVGFGPPLEEHVVRSLIFARLANFVSGHAAVSLVTAHRVAAMLDGRALPVVPRHGQDSSGELAQQYNLYHALHDEQAEVKDQNVLTNGSPCSAALAADVALDADRRLRNAGRIFALSIQAGAMPMEPYDRAWKTLFGDPFEAEAIDALQDALCALQGEHRAYQAPVSWRIIVRILGLGHRCVHSMREAAEIGLRAVTDNPVFMMPDTEHPNGYTLQSGGFHNCLSYHAMGWLNAAWVDFTVLATRHIEQLHRHSVSALPENLVPPGEEPRTRYLEASSLNASLDALAYATPVTIPHGAGRGQTDIINPVFRAYDKTREVGRRFDICLASLAVVASQALWIAKRSPAPRLVSLLETIREHCPPLDSTRNLGKEVESLANALGGTVA